MMQDSISGAIQKMGSNFIVAAFVPAMGFVIMCVLAFKPILPDALTARFGSTFIEKTFFALLFTTILGFTLYTLSTYIYKAFEGYTFILGLDTPIRRFLLRRQRSRIQNLENDLRHVKTELERIKRKIDSEREETSPSSWRKKRRNRYELRQSYLKDLHYSLVATRNEYFPPSSQLLLPTRFGNILRASEMYPGTRYGIDAVPIWGRLAHVIPSGVKDDNLGGMAMIDEANNQCLFLLNTSLLAFTFAFLSFLVSIYQSLLLWAHSNSVMLLSFMPTNLETIVYKEAIGIYFVLALMSAGISWFFYKASLLNVSEYGAMIRAAYDLYRSRLLKQLNLPLPKNLEIERTTWRAVNEFMVGGNEFGEVKFDYIYYEKQTTQSEPEYVSIGDLTNS